MIPPSAPLPTGAAKVRGLQLLIAAIVFGAVATLVGSHYLSKDDSGHKGEAKTGVSIASAKPDARG